MVKKTKNIIIKPVFTDKRGDITDILEEPVSHIGMITFRKGVERANHYHKKSTQYSYILSGRIKLTTSDINGKNKKNYILKPGTLTSIPPNIIHVYKALTSAKILDMTTLNRKAKGYEEDTVRIS